jgi:hypothetical protein
MAPPIKQENLPVMEDCRLLLKNAVEIKLKGLFTISRRMALVVFWDSLDRSVKMKNSIVTSLLNISV